MDTMFPGQAGPCRTIALAAAAVALVVAGACGDASPDSTSAGQGDTPAGQGPAGQVSATAEADGAGAAITGYEQLLEVVTVPGGSAATYEIDCPAGKVAFGGGTAAVAGEVDRSGHLGVSYYSESGSWLVLPHSPTGHDAELRLVCADPPAGFEVDARADAVPGGSVRRLRATCGAGKVTVGGGVQADLESQVVQYVAPLPDGRGWEAAVYRPGEPQDSGFAYVIVHCADPPAGYQLVDANFQAPRGEHIRHTVGCPAGTRILSGGFRLEDYSPADPVANLKLLESAPVEDAGTDQWLVGFVNEGPPRRGAVWAVCAAAG